MRKILVLFNLLIYSYLFSQDTLTLSSLNLDEVTITSIYRSKTSEMSEFTVDKLLKLDYGQEPSFVFKTMPSIYSRSDNGTEFGYGYFYIRGLDQTRINVTLDGMPWNEAEDFGAYFANSPDIMASMHSIKVERGASSKNNGVAACAGNISLESVDLKKDTISNVNIVYGSFNSHKVSVTYNMGIKKGFGFHIRATQSGTDGYRDNSWNKSHAITAKVGYYFNNHHNITFLSINGFHKNCQGWIGGTKENLENIKYNGNTKDETDNWIQSVNKLQYTGWLTDNTMLSVSAYLQYQTGSYRMDLDNYMHKVYCDKVFYSEILYDYGLTHYLYGSNVVLNTNINFASLSCGINAYGFQRRHYMGDKGKNTELEYYDNTSFKIDVAPFINVNFEVCKGLTIGGNLQYRYVNFKYKDKVNPSVAALDTTLMDYHFVNYGAHINYIINKNHNIYVNYSCTNREATRSTMFGGNEYYVKEYYENISPETVHDIEVGYNISYNRIKGNVNLFYMHFNNELIVDGTTGYNGLPSHINANKSFRSGVELTTDWNIIDGLHWINNISYSVNKFTKDTLHNNVQPYSPSWTINEDFVDTWKYRNTTFTFGVNFNFKDKIYIDIYNNHKLPVSMTLNFYGNVNISDVCEIGFKLNNLTNKTDNYCYGSVNANDELMVVQECGINVLGSIKFIF